MYTNPYSVRRARNCAHRLCYEHQIVASVCTPLKVFEIEKRLGRLRHDKGNGNKIKNYDYLHNTTNSQYLDNLYTSWLKNPSSVDASWNGYFSWLQENDQPQETAKAQAVRVESATPIVPANLKSSKPSGWPICRVLCPLRTEA